MQDRSAGPPDQVEVFAFAEPWSAARWRYGDVDRWKRSARLRPLRSETVEEALAHIDTPSGWRRAIPGRGYGRKVWHALVLADVTNEFVTEAELAEQVGCSRSAVSRWKRWLRSHRYIDWVHVRWRGWKWARCRYVTDGTEGLLVAGFLGSDALSVTRWLEATGRGGGDDVEASRRAELLLEEALSRAKVGKRHATCYVLGKYLRRVGLTLSEAKLVGADFAARVEGAFPTADGHHCIRSAYRSA